MIERDEDCTVITGDHVNLYRAITLEKMLLLEIKTGLKMSSHGSVAVAIRHAYGLKSRRKVKLAAELRQYINNRWPKED